MITVSPKALSTWLIFVALLVFCIVVVGGITRLTESGLSITEWKPVSGVIPPLNAADWAAEFEKYRQIPEYQLVNKGMSLADLKPFISGNGSTASLAALSASRSLCHSFGLRCDGLSPRAIRCAYLRL